MKQTQCLGMNLWGMYSWPYQLQSALRIHGVYTRGFNQPQMGNIWEKSPRKFQKAKLCHALSVTLNHGNEVMCAHALL